MTVLLVIGEKYEKRHFLMEVPLFLNGGGENDLCM
jgi:hypothetical protein